MAFLRTHLVGVPELLLGMIRNHVGFTNSKTQTFGYEFLNNQKMMNPT